MVKLRVSGRFDAFNNSDEEQKFTGHSLAWTMTPTRMKE